MSQSLAAHWPLYDPDSFKFNSAGRAQVAHGSGGHWPSGEVGVSLVGPPTCGPKVSPTTPIWKDSLKTKTCIDGQMRGTRWPVCVFVYGNTLVCKWGNKTFQTLLNVELNDCCQHNFKEKYRWDKFNTDFYFELQCIDPHNRRGLLWQ